MLGNAAHKFNGNTTKRTRDDNRVNYAAEEIVTEYQKKVQKHFVKVVTRIEVGEYFGAEENCVILECWEHPNHTVKGFTNKTSKVGGKMVKIYQYDLRNVKCNLGTNRPCAWRVPFLIEPAEYVNKKWTISHLCHNTSCYNWNHHRLEPLPLNQGRNGCPGGLHCHNLDTCMIPGPTSHM